MRVQLLGSEVGSEVGSDPRVGVLVCGGVGRYERWMSNENELILVTGGCGFIGSNYVRHLLSVSAKAKVVVLDKLTYAGPRQSGNRTSQTQKELLLGGQSQSLPRITFRLNRMTPIGIL